jgi:hypothetical protein
MLATDGLITERFVCGTLDCQYQMGGFWGILASQWEGRAIGCRVAGVAQDSQEI